MKPHTMPPISKSSAQPVASSEGAFAVPLSATGRTRMVSFRLTKEEHERYHKICSTLGIRGFSELVRIAIDSFVQHPSPMLASAAVESRLSEIETCLRILTGEIKRLNDDRSPAAKRQAVSLPSLSQTMMDYSAASTSKRGE